MEQQLLSESRRLATTPTWSGKNSQRNVNLRISQEANRRYAQKLKEASMVRRRLENELEERSRSLKSQIEQETELSRGRCWDRLNLIRVSVREQKLKEGSFGAQARQRFQEQQGSKLQKVVGQCQQREAQARLQRQQRQAQRKHAADEWQRRRNKFEARRAI